MHNCKARPLDSDHWLILLEQKQTIAMAVRQTESCWKKFANIRFIVTVEPVLLLYISALTMYNPLLQQYMYDNVSKYFNFTAADSQDICGKTGQRNFTNSSLPNFSSMTYMPSKSNQKRDVYELENKVQTETSHWILYFNMASKYSLFLKAKR